VAGLKPDDVVDGGEKPAAAEGTAKRGDSVAVELSTGTIWAAAWRQARTNGIMTAVANLFGSKG